MFYLISKYMYVYFSEEIQEIGKTMRFVPMSSVVMNGYVWFTKFRLGTVVGVSLFESPPHCTLLDLGLDIIMYIS